MKRTFLMQYVTVNALVGLNSLAWAQFILNPQQKLTLTPPPYPTNGANYTDSLKQTFNLSEINFLDLIDFKEKDAYFFQNGSLSSFSELTRLTISSSKLFTLPERALEGLPKLRHLNISSSGMQQVPQDLLHYTPALHEVILSFNEFTQLPENMFQNISSLVILDLRSNELVSLGKEAFRNLKIVYQFYLNDNQLTTLGEGIFDDLADRLSLLNLSNNHLSLFDDQIFAKLKKLTNLLLVRAFSQNVTTLPSNIFYHLARVEVINLDSNNLQNLPEDIFHQNRELETLSLAYNNLTSLGDAIFQNNTKLQKLYLNHNNLMFLSENVFSKLTELRELYLQHNHLSSLSPFIFSRLASLITIQISNNSVDMSGPNENYSNLFNCHDVENIYASKNSIVKIYDDWIDHGKLKVLDLRYTRVSGTKVEPKRFRADQVTIHLNDQDAAEIKLKKMTLLELDSTADRKFIMDKNPACGSNCSCIFNIDYDHNRTVLKCVRFNEKELLEKIPSYLVRFAASIENVELDLSKCNLTSLYPVKGWLEQLNVTKLSLSNNRLSHLDGLPELPRLMILELHNNKFTSIDRETLGILQRAANLKRFSLHNNPWICECSSKKFFEYLQLYKIDRKIPKQDKITCANLNKELLLKVDSQSLCSGQPTVIRTPATSQKRKCNIQHPVKKVFGY